MLSSSGRLFLLFPYIAASITVSEWDSNINRSVAPKKHWGRSISAVQMWKERGTDMSKSPWLRGGTLLSLERCKQLSNTTDHGLTSLILKSVLDESQHWCQKGTQSNRARCKWQFYSYYLGEMNHSIKEQLMREGTCGLSPNPLQKAGWDCLIPCVMWVWTSSRMEVSQGIHLGVIPVFLLENTLTSPVVTCAHCLLLASCVHCLKRSLAPPSLYPPAR